MDNQRKDSSILSVLKLKHITEGLKLKTSTAKYAAKNSDQIHDMPPEGVSGKPRLFTLEQATRFAAVVMLIRSGVRIDDAGEVMKIAEGVADAANEAEGNDSTIYRYSVGEHVDTTDPWKLTIREDNVASVWRKHVAELGEREHGHLQNMMIPFVVTTREMASEQEFDWPMSEFTLNLTQIENRLAELMNAKS